MNKKYTLGVDIGGSHISCIAMDMTTHTLVKDSFRREHLSHTDTAQNIFKSWAKAINECMQVVGIENVSGLGFAIPGPFNYKDGISLMQHKYPSLYNLHIPTQLQPFLLTPLPMRFLNDASAFAVGVSWIDKAKGFDNVVVITLGTGFGSAYIQDGVPVVTGEKVAPEGCFWHLPFKEGIADEYFSTRWFVSAFEQKTGKSIKGVKELIQTSFRDELFDEFATNLGSFLAPWLKKFDANILVLGGNISLAYAYFEEKLNQTLQANNINIPIVVSSLMEEAAMVGASRLFEESFWQKISKNLPNV